MFYLCSKLLAFLLSPVTWLMIALLLLLFIKRKHSRKMLIVGIVIYGFILTNDYLANSCARLWGYLEYNELEQEEHYEWLVVAGGFSGYNSRLDQIDVNENGDRLIEAIRLMKSNRVEKVLISGDAASNIENNRTTRHEFMEELCELGVDTTRVYIEPYARNTRENATFSMEMLSSTNGMYCKKILLMTSGYHAYRTRKCYEKAGFDCDMYVVDIPDLYKGFNLRMLFPDWYAAMVWDQLVHEWVGCLSYKMAGYI